MRKRRHLIGGVVIAWYDLDGEKHLGFSRGTFSSKI